MSGRALTENELLERTLQAFQDCSDLTHRYFPLQKINIVYFDHLVGKEQLRAEVLEPIGRIDPFAVSELFIQTQYKLTPNAEDLVEGILNGNAAVYFGGQAYLYDAYDPESRSIQPSETESAITGPQDSFTESLGTNLSLIRRRLKDSRLKTISVIVGRKTRTKVNLLYMEGVADTTHIQQLLTRIKSLDIESVYDTNTLVQYLNPYPNSLFPQLLTSMRPDLITSKLAGGKVAGLLDGSPVVFSAPTSFFEFFSSPDDYYQPWAVGSALRLLRFIALFITLGFTPLYVTIVTYNYEMIPTELLYNLMESRSKVPFPPLMEAIFMEMTIELLREAGARLPTKIGQTIGIVGGIVIGQATVTAGITSNIMIIVVAISAIASFAIPNYIMSASIRLLRFGIILLAGMLGNFGLMFGIGFIIIQLSGISVFGLHFLEPIAPSKPSVWMDTIARAPMRWIDHLKKRVSNKV